MLPPVGWRSPSSSLSKVVLPVPLAPSRPIRSERCSTRLKSRISGSPPGWAKLTFSATITCLPDFSAVSNWKLALPWRSRRSERSARMALSARTRPSLRVRRALMPWRIQTSSWARRLSNSALAVSSAASCCSLCTRKLA
ncbi:hypothetical protein D3C84_819700 [compost metagenome]